MRSYIILSKVSVFRSKTLAKNLSKNIVSNNIQMEEAKKLAAFTAVNDHLKDNMIVGIGSGSTIVYAVEKIAEKVKSDQLSIICVPTSFQAKQLIRKHNLVLSDLEYNFSLDITFDGADEVDTNLNLIKGGGGCLTQEKIVASASKKLIIVADYTKQAKSLGEKWKNGIPIEAIPMSYMFVKKTIESRYGGNAVLRIAKAKAGPLVTDNSNFILDWKFNSDFDKQWAEVDISINNIPGVVQTGLFIKMATQVYFGNQDGTISILKSEV